MPNALFGGNSFNPYAQSFQQPYRPLPATPVSGFAPSQPIMQNVQSMVPQSNIIWIDDVSQIANFPTGRGWQQWFGLKNEQTFYVRETDMNGVTQPLRRVVYQLEEIQTNEPPASANPATPADTVSREEFNKLSESVNLMTEKLADLLK